MSGRRQDTSSHNEIEPTPARQPDAGRPCGRLAYIVQLFSYGARILSGVSVPCAHWFAMSRMRRYSRAVSIAASALGRGSTPERPGCLAGAGYIAMARLLVLLGNAV